MSKDMGMEELLIFLEEAKYKKGIPKDPYAQLVKIVELHFSEGHLIPMGNGASQCKYCGASFLPSWEDKPNTQTERPGEVKEATDE